MGTMSWRNSVTQSRLERNLVGGCRYSIASDQITFEVCVGDQISRQEALAYLFADC
jgi:hypothetical protein